MNLFISVLIGCIIAVMLAFNGGLSAQYGVFGSTVIIHIVGTTFAFAAIKLRKMKLNITRDIPLWMFCGGAIGVLTTLFNNFSFGKIGITAIMALGLFGQGVTSAIIDCFGLFGMPKRKYKKLDLIGILFAVIGILIMLEDIENAAFAAILMSLAAGVTIVLSRTVNADLSGKIGALQGAFVNHFVGLPITVAMLLMLGRAEPIFTGFSLSPKLWIYLGGALGVIVVMLFNVMVPKVKAFNLTLLTFVGQVFAGILIDIITKQPYSQASFYGSTLVAAGIFTNILLGHFSDEKERKKGIDAK
ncbi:MAG: DMT family transporter [Oscillospiraceae bacterium]